MLHDVRLVITAGFVDGNQHSVQMLRYTVFLIQHQCVQQLGGFDPSLHDPVTEVCHDARQDLGEVMIDERTTAEVRPLN